MLNLCPYCHSANVNLIRNVGNQTSNPSQQLSSVASIASLGVTLAKQVTQVNPLMAGMAMLVLDGLFTRNVAPRPAPLYSFYCQDCQQVFN